MPIMSLNSQSININNLEGLRTWFHAIQTRMFTTSDVQVMLDSASLDELQTLFQSINRSNPVKAGDKLVLSDAGYLVLELRLARCNRDMINDIATKISEFVHLWINRSESSTRLSMRFHSIGENRTSILIDGLRDLLSNLLAVCYGESQRLRLSNLSVVGLGKLLPQKSWIGLYRALLKKDSAMASQMIHSLELLLVPVFPQIVTYQQPAFVQQVIQQPDEWA